MMLRAALLAVLALAAGTPPEGRADAATTATVQGESLVASGGSTAAVSARNAVAGRALLLGPGATLTIALTGRVDRIAVRVSGARCSGWPSLRARLDGKVVATKRVRGRRWAVVRFNPRRTTSTGGHTFTLRLVNGRRSAHCLRAAYLDWVSARALTDASPISTAAGAAQGSAPDAPADAPDLPTVTALPGGGAGGTGGSGGGGSGGSTTVTRLYVDPDTGAAAQAAAWRGGRPADARLMDKIAGQSQAIWIGGWSGDDAIIDRALQRAGGRARVVFALYALPNRDCGQHSSGGLSAADYRGLVDRVAGKIGKRPALVVIEPDGTALTSCLTSAQVSERNGLLRYAVDHLGGLADTRVYLDAGNARWKPAADMASRLNAAGVAGADGFALNVSNFGALDQEVTYGRQIAAGVGGKPFVVDTSRNGNGPPAGATGEAAWCNPAGRALGNPPTMSPGIAGVAALLWVKRPGESDGTCNGGPTSGAWFADYALGLARGAHW